MGCDIHFFVEKKAKNGRWVRAEAMIPNPYYEKDSEYEPDRQKEIRDTWYSGRNYRLFSVLNGTRSWGWENPLQIDQSRGLPEDVGSEVLKQYKWEEGDAHSESYYTLEELDAYDWDSPRLEISGYLSPEQFYDYITDGYPAYWLEEEYPLRFPDRLKIISMMEMKTVLDGIIEEVKAEPMKADRAERMSEQERFKWGLMAKSFGKDVMCPFTTMVSARQWITEDTGRGFQATINTMKLLADAEYGGDMSKVRCVFWYDN